MASPKELRLNEKLEDKLQGRARVVFQALSENPEVSALQEYANTVSIKRLGYNDHGPVHMRKVTLNALKMAEILRDRNVPLSLEREEVGTWEDSVTALTAAAFLHDVGMSVARSHHEMTGIWIVLPALEAALSQAYADDLVKKVIVRSLAVEGILGHMATVPIHSLEAGILLVADGCDMEKGRARIPLMIGPGGRIGDIHKYSAAAIERVRITEGDQRPIRIEIRMSGAVGFHQVEEVLFPKIKASPLLNFIELRAQVGEEEPKIYL